MSRRTCHFTDSDTAKIKSMQMKLTNLTSHAMFNIQTLNHEAN